MNDLAKTKLEELADRIHALDVMVKELNARHEEERRRLANPETLLCADLSHMRSEERSTAK